MKGTKKKVLATFIICFSICSLLTGFAAGFVSLLIIPGLIVAFLVLKALIEPDMSAVNTTTVKGDIKGGFREVLKNKNIIVCLIYSICLLGWCGAGCIAVFEGPVPTESINPKFASTAVGFIQGFGEIAGGSLGAALAGVMADRYRLAAPMWQCAALMVVGTVVICFIYEMAPVVLAKRQAKADGTA